MSKYIHQDNQRLLWNVSQKIPNIQHVFPQMSQQERWFKDTIQHFYDKRKYTHLSKRGLEELNKETVQYMIAYVAANKDRDQKIETSLSKHNSRNHSKNVTFGTEPVGAYPTYSDPNTFIPITPRPQTIVGEPRVVSTNLLEERQRDYDNMLKREVPAEPNFRELEKDTVIDNMDELLQQQMRERELLYLPNEPNSGNNHVLSPQEAPKIVPPRKASRTLKIQEELNGLPEESNGVIPLEHTYEVTNTPLLMDLLLEIRNELRQLRHLYHGKVKSEETVVKEELEE